MFPDRVRYVFLLVYAPDHRPERFYLPCTYAYCMYLGLRTTLRPSTPCSTVSAQGFIIRRPKSTPISRIWVFLPISDCPPAFKPVFLYGKGATTRPVPSACFSMIFLRL